MKFDLIISNPPYNRILDLKILKEIYGLSERICFVHPATWLYDKKNKHSLFISTKDIVKSNFKLYEKVENANRIFNIRLFVDVFITYFDKSIDTPSVNIDDIDIHGNSEIYKSLKKKILTYCETANFNSYLKGYFDDRPQKNQNILSFTPIRGHPGVNDFYTILGNHIIPNNFSYLDKSYYTIWLEFDSYNEVQNSLEYLKTKIARFCLSIYKINQNLNNGELASVPYMPTYTRPWTDEDVAKELGLTDEELAWAINWIPDYYPEDAEKYAKYKNT